MTHQPAAAVRDGESAAGAILLIVLAAVVLLGAWLVVLEGGRRPSVTVNPDTDNAVPTVYRQQPAGMARA